MGSGAGAARLRPGADGRLGRRLRPVDPGRRGRRGLARRDPRATGVGRAGRVPLEEYPAGSTGPQAPRGASSAAAERTPIKEIPICTVERKRFGESARSSAVSDLENKPLRRIRRTSSRSATPGWSSLRVIPSRAASPTVSHGDAYGCIDPNLRPGPSVRRPAPGHRCSGGRVEKPQAVPGRRRSGSGSWLGRPAGRGLL